ncbi:hypothetical protein QBC43DRAFT_288613 [Cladorrhinum sp. PSN259]|nr:hypothetical protein QBC43DRAFT_288613 [Cladorrhinum sp. PSN259]
MQWFLAAQPADAFFVRGQEKRPTRPGSVLEAYALAIGASATTFIKNPRANLTTRSKKKELCTPATFSRSVLSRLHDKHGRLSMTQEDLIQLLTSHSTAMKNLYAAGARPGAAPNPLLDAVTLLYEEATALSQDYFLASNLACEALRAVQNALRSNGSRSEPPQTRRKDKSSTAVDRGLEPPEVIVGWTFDKSVLNDNARWRSLAEDFAKSLGCFTAT